MLVSLSRNDDFADAQIVWAAMRFRQHYLDKPSVP